MTEIEQKMAILRLNTEQKFGLYPGDILREIKRYNGSAAKGYPTGIEQFETRIDIEKLQLLGNLQLLVFRAFVNNFENLGWSQEEVLEVTNLFYGFSIIPPYLKELYNELSDNVKSDQSINDFIQSESSPLTPDEKKAYQPIKFSRDDQDINDPNELAFWRLYRETQFNVQHYHLRCLEDLDNKNADTQYNKEIRFKRSVLREYLADCIELKEKLQKFFSDFDNVFGNYGQIARNISFILTFLGEYIPDSDQFKEQQYKPTHRLYAELSIALADKIWEKLPQTNPEISTEQDKYYFFDSLEQSDNTVPGWMEYIQLLEHEDLIEVLYNVNTLFPELNLFEPKQIETNIQGSGTDLDKPTVIQTRINNSTRKIHVIPPHLRNLTSGNKRPDPTEENFNFPPYASFAKINVPKPGLPSKTSPNNNSDSSNNNETGIIQENLKNDFEVYLRDTFFKNPSRINMVNIILFLNSLKELFNSPNQGDSNLDNIRRLQDNLYCDNIQTQATINGLFNDPESPLSKTEIITEEVKNQLERLIQDPVENIAENPNPMFRQIITLVANALEKQCMESDPFLINVLISSISFATQSLLGETITPHGETTEPPSQLDQQILNLECGENQQDIKTKLTVLYKSIESFYLAGVTPPLLDLVGVYEEIRNILEAHSDELLQQWYSILTNSTYSLQNILLGLTYKLIIDNGEENDDTDHTLINAITYYLRPLQLSNMTFDQIKTSFSGFNLNETRSNCLNNIARGIILCAHLAVYLSSGVQHNQEDIETIQYFHMHINFLKTFSKSGASNPAKLVDLVGNSLYPKEANEIESFLSQDAECEIVEKFMNNQGDITLLKRTTEQRFAKMGNNFSNILKSIASSKNASNEERPKIAYFITLLLKINQTVIDLASFITVCRDSKLPEYTGLIQMYDAEINEAIQKLLKLKPIEKTQKNNKTLGFGPQAKLYTIDNALYNLDDAWQSIKNLLERLNEIFQEQTNIVVQNTREKLQNKLQHPLG